MTGNWKGSRSVVVAGVGYSDITRSTNRPLGTFTHQAVHAALDDCGLEPSKIDGLATFPMAPFAGARNVNGLDVITPEFFLNDHRFSSISWYSQAGEGMIAASIGDAASALISGQCTYALVWRAMYVPPGTYGKSGGAGGSPSAYSSGDEQFIAPYGCVSPIQWHGLAYRAYLERYRQRREDMLPLALNSRRNANLNPNAIFSDRELTEADYRSARMVSDPLCLYDCDVPVMACVALVMTTSDRAGDLARKPVSLAAVGLQTSPAPRLLNYALRDHMEPGRALADKLWAYSGLGPGDMSAAQVYDGFSPTALYWLESAGFCGEGEALSFIQDGRIALEGELPVNTAGGSLSQGRLHGMGHIAEAVLQLRGEAGPRQIERADAMVVFDGSPMLRGGGLILTATA